MLVKITNRLFINPKLITQISYADTRKRITISVSDGSNWELSDHTMASFDKIVGNVNKGLK